MLAVKLLDENNNYDEKLFDFIKSSRNNLKYKYPSDYQLDLFKYHIFYARWDDFIGNVNGYVDLLLEIWQNRDKYDIRKNYLNLKVISKYTA